MPRTPQRTRHQQFIVTSGDSVTGESGGGLTLLGGPPDVSGVGAPVTLLGGTATGANPAGAIVMTAGDAATGVAGNVVLTPGTNGAGAVGLVSITRSGLQLTERTTVPGPTIASGQGRLWLRDDLITSLVYTDDSGAVTSLGLHAPERGHYSVLEFGASMNPLVNSRQAFQDACDACEAAGGGVVWAPPVLDVLTQAYLVTGTVTIGANVVVAGLGPRSIVHGRPLVNNAAFAFAAGANRGGIRDLVLLGNDAAALGIGVSFTGSQSNTIERLQIWDFEIGIDVSDGVTAFSAYNIIIDTEINRSTLNGIRADQYANGVAIIGGRIFYTFSGTGRGIALELSNARAVSVNGLSLEAYDVGIQLSGTTSGSIAGTWMEKGPNDPPGTNRVDFEIASDFSESLFFEGNVSFEGNHHTDPWPLRSAIFNVRDFGAQGNNAHADADGIQAAADAARDAGGGAVYFPPGVYLLGTTTVTYATNVTFQGAGAQSTIISYAGSNYAFEQETPTVRIFNVRFYDLQVSYTNTLAIGGIHLNDVSLARCNNVAVFGPGIGNGFGIHVSGSTNGFAVYNRFDHTRALSCNYGFNIDVTGSNDTHFTDCRATACTRGISITNSNHVVVEGSAIEGCTTGIYVESLTTSLSDGLTVIGNRFESNATSNITVGGTATFVRHINIKANHHVTGTPYTNVFASTTPNVFGDTGTAAGIAYVVSTQADTPYHFERTASGATNLPGLRIRDSNTGSGTPNTLQVSCGRATGHALSINQWNGTTDTERMYITGAGDIVSTVGATLGTNLTFTGAASTITLGDGVVDGNAQVLFQKTSGGNKTSILFRNGTASSGNRQAVQFNSGQHLAGVTFDDSGVVHTHHAWESRRLSTEGRSGWAVQRFWGDLATALTNTDFAPTNWGTDVSISVATGSRDLRGQVTVTTGSTGMGTDPSLVLTFPDGTWATAPFAMVVRDGGTGTILTGFTWSTTATTLTISATGGTPTSGEIYIYSWMMMG